MLVDLTKFQQLIVEKANKVTELNGVLSISMAESAKVWISISSTS